MILRERFLDFLSKIKLVEMAHSRAKALDIVQHSSSNIMTHLLKVLTFRDDQNQKHWVQEIDAWMIRISEIKLKHNSKHLDQDTLYQWLIFDSGPIYNTDWVSSTLQMLFNRGYNKSTPRTSLSNDEIIQKILNIIQQFSKDVECGNFISVERYF